MYADAVVVGAGPAGSTTARLLARQGWDVLLVDRARFPRPKTCGDGLTPRCVATLERLGLLPQLLEAGHARVSGVRLVAPAGHEWRSSFADSAPGLPGYGLVVPRSELDQWLRWQAQDEGARVLERFHAEAALRKNGCVTGLQGTLQGNVQTIHARATVAATGASVGLPRALGVMERLPPMVYAARIYLEGVEGLEGEFEFHFRRGLSPGYAWIFPGPQDRANIGVVLFSVLRGANNNSNPKQHLQRFLEQPGLRPRLRRARQVSPMQTYPLRTDYPRSPVHGPGFLLAGEAAGLVSPITGEGIDLALESGEIAAAVAGEALRSNDVSARALKGYERELHRHFAHWFRGLHRLMPWVMRPGALDILIAKAKRWPSLGQTILRIVLRSASPWLALSPRTWRCILL